MVEWVGQQPWEAMAVAEVRVGRGWRRKEEDRGTLVQNSIYPISSA